jgi:protoheme IX farnesyltransferase
MPGLWSSFSSTNGVAVKQLKPVVHEKIKTEVVPVNQKNNSASVYWKLSKGHLSVWVAFSALPGYLVSAPFSLPSAALLFSGTALASAASQALNQAREASRDAKMARTHNRPIPSGKLSVLDAKKFALLAGLSGTTLLTLGSVGMSLAPATIALSTILLYVNVYTPMKTTSCYNTHVGAVAGSLPVLIGFAAAQGFPVFLSPEPWVLLGLQTLWQFPHFYPLAWMYKEDYIRGGYRMFPLTDDTGLETAKMCLPYMIALTTLPCIASLTGATSWMFPISGSVVNALWLQQWYTFYRNPSKGTARKYFLGSLWYLVAMLGLYVVHVEETEGSPVSVWRHQVKERLTKLCVHEREAKDASIPPSLCPVK